MLRVARRLGAFVVLVIGGLSLLLLGGSFIGFLLYSDRPGPGYYGPAFSFDLQEGRFLLTFLGFLVVPVTFAGAVVLAVESLEVRLRLPTPSVRIAGALAAGLFTGLVTAGVGWYIALSGEAAGLALLIGALSAFIVFPRRISLGFAGSGWRALLRGVVVTILGIPLALGPFVALTAVMFNVRGPVVYEIPGGYRGWVHVRYERDECPALRLRGVDLIVPVDERGCGCSLSEAPWPGTWRATTRYAYARSDTTRELRPAVLPNSGGKIVDPQGEIWDISEGNVQYAGESRSRGYDSFYIGSQREFEVRTVERWQHEDACRGRAARGVSPR